MVTKTSGGASARPAARTTKKPASRAKRPPAPPPRPPFWWRQARDLWAVGLITLGVLLALALWGKQLGPIGHGVDTGLGLVAGWVRVLLPLVSFGAGLALLLDRAGLEDDEEHEGWTDIPETLARGVGDCKDLVAWRLAELRVRERERALPLVRFARVGHRVKFHVVVRRADGRVECPSYELGMR